MAHCEYYTGSIGIHASKGMQGTYSRRVMEKAYRARLRPLTSSGLEP